MSSTRWSFELGSPLRRRGAALSLLLLAGGFAGCGKPAAESAPPPPAAKLKTLHDNKLTVCLYPNFQPFAGEDANQVWSGWDYAYLQDFSHTQGLGDVEVYVSNDFDGIWNLPGDDKCDIAGSGISDLQTRRDATGAKGVWSSHYYKVQRSFAVDQQASIKSLDDLAGKKVYVTQNSTADLDLTNRIKCGNRNPADFDIVRNNDEGGDVDQVLAGCAFAYGGGYGSILYLTKDTHLKADWTHDYMDETCKEVPEPFSFVVRAASEGLPEALDAFIGKDGPTYPGNQPNPETGTAEHHKVECKK